MDLFSIILISVAVIGILICLFIIFLPSSDEDIKNNTIDINSNGHRKSSDEKLLKIKQMRENDKKIEKLMSSILKWMIGIALLYSIIIAIFSDDRSLESSITCRTMLQKGANMGYGNSSVSFAKNETKTYGYFLVKTPNAFGGKEESCVKCYYNDRGGANNIEFVSRDNCNQKW